MVTDDPTPSTPALLGTDEQLLRRYAAGEIAARDEIARRYMPMARRMTARYRSTSQHQEDLHQVAYVALLKAIDRYDPQAGDFAGYVFISIRGALKRHFRDHASPIRITRELQERWQRVNAAQQKLTSTLGRTPTTRDIAAALDLELDEVLEAMDAGSTYSVRELDAPVRGDESDLVLGDLVGDEDAGYATVDFGASIEPAFARLSEREREIVRLRFQEDRTQREIGEAVGISQMHVSRLLRGALQRLHRAAAPPEHGGGR